MIRKKDLLKEIDDLKWKLKLLTEDHKLLDSSHKELEKALFGRREYKGETVFKPGLLTEMNIEFNKENQSW